MIEVDLTGAFFGMKYEIDAMLKTGGGAIVNTASVFGVVANAHAWRLHGRQAWCDRPDQAGRVDYGKKNSRVNAVLPALIMPPIVEAAMRDPGLCRLL